MENCSHLRPSVTYLFGLIEINLIILHISHKPMQRLYKIEHLHNRWTRGGGRCEKFWGGMAWDKNKFGVGFKKRSTQIVTRGGGGGARTPKLNNLKNKHQLQSYNNWFGG